MGLSRLAQEAPEVSPETTVTQAVKLMTERRVGAVVVTAHDRLMGIFTERDLMRRVVAAHLDADGTAVGKVMTSPVQTVRDSATVADAASIMRSFHIRHLAIIGDTDDGLRGLLGLRYLLYDFLDDLGRRVDSLESYIMADSLGG